MKPSSGTWEIGYAWPEAGYGGGKCPASVDWTTTTLVWKKKKKFHCSKIVQQKMLILVHFVTQTEICSCL